MDESGSVGRQEGRHCWPRPHPGGEEGLGIQGSDRPRCKPGAIPCIDLKGLTAAQKRAYVIADNQLALRAGWDVGLLSCELGDLKLAGFDLDLLGFENNELVKFMAGKDGLTDPDEVPPAPVVPVSRTGDLWLLGGYTIKGAHRLLVGDSTKAADVARLMGGATPILMVTDPPYGVDYDPNWRNVEAAKGNLAYAASRVGPVGNDDRVDWHEAWGLFPGDVAYVWHADRHASEVQRSLETAGFAIRCQLIWSKSNFPISRGHYHWRHEPCWYAVRNGATGKWHGDRKQTTVREINLDKNVEGGHSTQKPVECMRFPIENNTAHGDGVYDPFVGSGTTIIAAEMMARRCYAMEIAPQYVDVSVQRWQQFTGKQATLDGDGRTFAEIAAERVPERVAEAA